MNENTNPTGEAGTSTPAAEERTFTQEQVNAIVGERLAKEKGKNDAALAEREQELARRELTLTAREKLNSMALPVELLDALNISSAEALEKSLAIMEKILNAKQPQESETPPVKRRPFNFAGGGMGAGGIGNSSGPDPMRGAFGLGKK